LVGQHCSFLTHLPLDQALLAAGRLCGCRPDAIGTAHRPSAPQVPPRPSRSPSGPNDSGVATGCRRGCRPLGPPTWCRPSSSSTPTS
jgi:hypothetical protein